MLKRLQGRSMLPGANERSELKGLGFRVAYLKPEMGVSQN